MLTVSINYFQRKLIILRNVSSFSFEIKILGRSALVPNLCTAQQLFRSQIYFQSTAISITDKNKNTEKTKEFPILDTNFNQYQIAYRYRRTIELLRGYLVYRLFSIDFLVNNQAKVSRNLQNDST